MSKINNGGLDQYGAEPFKQQQFGTAGVEGVKQLTCGTCDCDAQSTSCCTFLCVGQLWCHLDYISMWVYRPDGITCLKILASFLAFKVQKANGGHVLTTVSVSFQHKATHRLVNDTITP